METINKSVTVGQHELCRIRSRRVAPGLEVTVTGGEKIAEIVKRLAEQEGQRRPEEVHGLKVWHSIRALDYLSPGMRVPSEPMLGPWILKASELGNPAGISFTLRHVFKKDEVMRETNSIKAVARAIYFEYCKALMVEAVVMVP